MIKKYGRVSSRALRSFTLGFAQSISKMMLLSTTENRSIKVYLVLVIRLNAYFTTETCFYKSTMYFTQYGIKQYDPSTLGGGRIRRVEEGFPHCSDLTSLHLSQQKSCH